MNLSQKQKICNLLSVNYDFSFAVKYFHYYPLKNILLYLLNDTTNRAAVKILFLKFLSIHSTSTEILTIVQIFNLIKINPTKHFSSCLKKKKKGNLTKKKLIAINHKSQRPEKIRNFQTPVYNYLLFSFSFPRAR